MFTVASNKILKDFFKDQQAPSITEPPLHFTEGFEILFPNIHLPFFTKTNLECVLLKNSSPIRLKQKQQ